MPDLLVAIDRALCAFGKSVRHAIYYHLSNEGRVNINELMTNSVKLSRDLQALFGSGSLAVERLIVREINLEFGIDATSLDDALEKVQELAVFHRYPSNLR